MQDLVDKLPWSIAFVSALGLAFVYFRFPQSRKAVGILMTPLRKRLMRLPKVEPVPPVVDEHGVQPKGTTLPIDSKEPGGGITGGGMGG